MKLKRIFSSPTRSIFILGTPLVALDTLYMHYYINCSAESGAALMRYLPLMAENIFAALTVLFCGAVLADILNKDCTS